jgi:hypothetical protein
VRAQQDHRSASHSSSIGEIKSPLDLDQAPVGTQQRIRPLFEKLMPDDRVSLAAARENPPRTGVPIAFL